MSENKLVLVILCLLGLGGCYFSYKFSPANSNAQEPSSSATPFQWTPNQNIIVPPTPTAPLATPPPPPQQPPQEPQPHITNPRQQQPPPCPPGGG